MNELARRAAAALLLVGSAAVTARVAAAADAPVDPAWSMAVGGELRERYETSRNRGFGLAGVEREDYLLQRALLHGELRHGGQARAYVELVSGATAGWSGSAPPTQQDSLDVLQAFVELPLRAETDELSLRIGRQELSFGSSRLVSTRESPNVRRSFDALRLTLLRPGGARIDLFVSRPVTPRTGSWNDGSSRGQTFWGGYAAVPLPGAGDVALDLYYLGLDQRESVFAQGVASELRHTLGSRLYGARGGFDWNVEAAGQWGAFGSAAIRAWTLSADLGLTWAQLPASPRLGLKADAISGDRDSGDEHLSTFNPLFPKLPYFSEANLVVPANLVDLQPTLTLELGPQLTLQFSGNVLWKQSHADAFYAPGAAPLSSAGNERFLGRQFSGTVEWHPVPRMTLAVSHVQFHPGPALRVASASSGTFTTAWVRWALAESRRCVSCLTQRLP
jgi:alginate export protein